MNVPSTSLRPLLLPGLALAAAAAVGTVGACTSSDSYVVVTVDAHPAVHDAKTLTVMLSNAGTSRSDDLALHDPTFPVTFSISAPGRAGDLAITIDAKDDSGAVVGHGLASTTVTAPDAEVMLDSTDFVVNTDYAGDQFPADDAGLYDADAGGFQVTALPDDTWTTVFRDGCTSGSCNVFARRFDKAGKPAQTLAAAGTNAFTVTSRPTTSSSIPAIASSQATTLAVWNFSDVGTSTTTGLACRTLDAGGNLGTSQLTIESTANFSYKPGASLTPLGNGNFAVTWRVFNAAVIDEIHMAILKPDCTPLGVIPPVAAGAQVQDSLHRGSVASSADRVLIAWVTNGDLHTRMASNAGAFSTTDTVLVPQVPPDEIKAARVVAASSGGFVVGARWGQKTGTTGPGRIELYRINSAGALVGSPTLVSDRTGGDDIPSASFTMASRSDGVVLVAWHACPPLGDDSMCGVFGRMYRDTGDSFTALTDPFVLPTTTLGDQKLPSVAALSDAFVAVWSDASATAPDKAGLAVRARLIYPPGN
ncbi:MAG TPA: hypothetical protein VHN14_09835 [Kofleriaceae bacterium]|nr:hypothetical protein [Kofleriaceae bacterium]